MVLVVEPWWEWRVGFIGSSPFSQCLLNIYDEVLLDEKRETQVKSDALLSAQGWLVGVLDIEGALVSVTVKSQSVRGLCLITTNATNDCTFRPKVQSQSVTSREETMQ